MHVHVLGAGAGGGFPQWNCHCPNCKGWREGTIKAKRRTQSSIAVGDGEAWTLCNASPDILQQLQEFSAVYKLKKQQLRGTLIRSIVLIDSQIDHTTGLLMLRESSEPLNVYCTQAVYDDLTTGNPLFRVLEHYCRVKWIPLQFTDGRCEFQTPDQPNLRWTAVALQSKAPPYSPHRNNSQIGDTVGLLVYDLQTNKKLFYAPGLGVIEPHLPPLFQQADCLMLDGTFWRDDEMVQLGINQKRGCDLGHLAQTGAGGMIEVMGQYPKARRVLIHINNTNPILNEDSVEFKTLQKAGIEVAYDTMEIQL